MSPRAANGVRGSGDEPRVHARGSGDDFRADRSANDNVCGFRHRRVRYGNDGDGLCILASGVFECRLCIRRSAAGCQSDDQITRGDFLCLEIGLGLFAAVFGALDGLADRFRSARDDGLNPFRRRTECGRTLGSVEDCHPPAAARTHINHSSAISDGVDGEIYSLDDFGYCGTDGRRHCGVFAVDDFQDSFRRKQIDVDRIGISALRAHWELFYAALWIR